MLECGRWPGPVAAAGSQLAGQAPGCGAVLIALLALAVVAVIGMVMRARRSGAASQSGASPFAFQGAGASNPAAAQAPHTYRPENVGNDASARPWERSSMAFDASRQAQGSAWVIGSGLGGPAKLGHSQRASDAEGFVSAAKRNFVTLQAAWDRSDIATLRST